MLWIFGDSFSAKFNHRSNMVWSNRYIKWKKYVPKTFDDFLSEKLNCEHINKSIGGIDCDTIFELICESAPHIKENDVIIIGWPHISRFRFPTNFNEWKTITTSHLDKTLTNVSKQTLEEILVNRTSIVYMNEYIKRRDFLNWVFRNNKIIHWTPCPDQYDYIIGFQNINTIKNETDSHIDESHYSEIGHKELSDIFFNLL